MTKIPLIIDADLTKDDVVAIALAANCPHIDIKAITCYGEWFMETVNLRDSLGLDCPVCWGAMKPLFTQETDLDVYGSVEADFEGNTRINPKDEEYPWDRIYAEAIKADGQLEIVTLGPVTNIAQTIMRYPQIKPLIKHIFCFAGSGYSGNVAPYSEYNAYVDPNALKVVFDSGIEVTMCGIDATQQGALQYDQLDNIHPINETVKKIVDGYRRTSQPDIDIPAAVAVSCYINRENLKTEKYYTTVETKGTITRGQTIVDRFGKYKQPANISVVTSANGELLVQSLHTLTR